MGHGPVYLDYQSTTPLDPRVTRALVGALGIFGNPHGRQHRFGRAAADAVDLARRRVAELLATYPDRIVFTSGATESCNLALRGAARAASPGRRRIVTVATEHAAVLDTVNDLARMGYETVVLPVEPDGLVDLDRFRDAVDEETLIVSVMAVNNEIGVMQPLNAIAAICRQQGALFHTDATQAPARTQVDVDAWAVDLLSVSAHKLYGPKGIGALYVADDALLEPISTGGGQERGIRSGTVPTALACAFGEAAKIAVEECTADAERMGRLAARIRDGMDALGARHFGSRDRRAPGTLSFGFRGISGNKLVAMVESKIAISTGAACSSGSASISHVLAALGCARAEARTGVRIGLGRFTVESDVDIALCALRHAIDAAQRGGRDR